MAVLNCDLDIKQAAAVTLQLTQALQGVAQLSNFCQTAAVNNAKSLSSCEMYQWRGIKGTAQNLVGNTFNCLFDIDYIGMDETTDATIMSVSHYNHCQQPVSLS